MVTIKCYFLNVLLESLVHDHMLTIFALFIIRMLAKV